MDISTPFKEALIGKKISHVWRGYGSAIFIELGELSSTNLKNGEPGQKVGEISLMIQWSWRIEKPKSILTGSWGDEKKWPAAFGKLINSEVVNVYFTENLPEITIELSNGLRVSSFMTAEGQPDWAIITRNQNLGTLCVKRGALFIEKQ